jgi:hypothetical protein
MNTIVNQVPSIVTRNITDTLVNITRKNFLKLGSKLEFAKQTDDVDPNLLILSNLAMTSVVN